ncbi:MAG TPA: MDR family MFS transporter [Mycobacteriales bacterium]|jgi:EmrB/QacA subfamily drug resistance transporter|nr:MDR family MFS transporter [Mycobacteriales bacterium]
MHRWHIPRWHIPRWHIPRLHHPRFARLHNPKVAVSVVFVASMFVNILDATIVNVALPTISADLGVPVTATATIAVGYLVSLAVFIPASGWLGDRFGTKRILLIALAVFTGASALCGLAQNLTELVLFRIIQGAGGGLLTPVGMAMLYRTFPPAERMRASRILTVPTTLAPATGPILGGLLVDQLSWRWIFDVNVPIGIAAFAFGLIFLRESREPDPGRFDVPGFLLAAGGLGLSMYALSEGASHGWGTPRIVVSGIVGIALLIAMVVVEMRSPAPMLVLRLFRDRLFRTANALTLMTSMAFLGTLYVFPLMLQDGLGYSPLAAGLSTFPEALGVMTAAQLVSRAYPLVGPRRLMGLGVIAVPLLMVTLAQTGLHPNAWLMRAEMYGLGFFMATIFMPNQTAAFATIGPASTGRASTIYNATRQIGSALGVAVLGTVLVIVGTTKRSGSGVVRPNLTAYHTAFYVAAILLASGMALVLTVRDSDAAATMVRRVKPTVETASPEAAVSPQTIGRTGS